MRSSKGKRSKSSVGKTSSCEIKVMHCFFKLVTGNMNGEHSGGVSQAIGASSRNNVRRFDFVSRNYSPKSSALNNLALSCLNVRPYALEMTNLNKRRTWMDGELAVSTRGHFIALLNRQN